ARGTGVALPGTVSCRKLLTGLAISLVAGAAMAADPRDSAIPPEVNHNVFGFAGVSTDEDMADTANLFGADYEDNVLVGLGYQRFFYETLGISIGGEVGVAGRFGDDNSAEFWGGVVGRYDGFVLWDTVRIAPAMT